MSNHPDTSTLAALYRELGQIVNVPTKREVELQNKLQALYALVGGNLLPGEMPFDAITRLIRDGITYNAIREEEHAMAQQKRVQEGLAKGNGLFEEAGR